MTQLALKNAITVFKIKCEMIRQWVPGHLFENANWLSRNNKIATRTTK
jgi:hypothetical protein